jgi:WD40 repeat protein
MPTPYHVRLAVSQYGEQFRAELFTEDLGDTEGDLLTELPPSIAEWVPYLAQGADLPPDSARQLGKDLFAALLGQPENAKKWAEVLTQAARRNQPIRLLIDATTEAVRDLPYGLLCEPHDDWFLFREGHKQSVEFVRILRRCSPRPLKFRERLRVLVAVAEPKSADVPPFDAPLRLQKLAAAVHQDVDLFLCGPTGPKPLAEIAPSPATAGPTAYAPYTKTTRDALRKAVAGEYDVFHLLAHGHGAGVLLCTDDGAPAETTASELGEWCGVGRTSLAFLQVCKAGQTASRGGFGGVAQQLLNPRSGNMAAVVASTFPLDAEHSTDAAVGFYRHLAAGRPPEEALTADRPETDWCWAFLELWARPGALSGTQPRAAFQFVSPYRGLSSFGEQDADLFFGRKAEVAELLQILRAEPAVAVVGDSGSGKTSLLQAGLVHAIRREGLAGCDRWRIVSVRPGYRPAQALLAALTGANAEPTPGALNAALLAVAQPLVIVFDQFEEVFTLARDKAELQMLTTALAAAVDQQRDRFRLVIGMRSEFLGQAASVPGLSRLIRRPWVLRPPGGGDMRDIVAGPAEHCGYTFQGPLADSNPAHSTGLLDRILADPLLARAEGGLTTAPLPLLQFALERLWLKAVEKGVTEFTHAAFDEIGGMGKAIAQHAEAVFQASATATELGAPGRALTEQIITALVSTQGTRQPRGREALQAETGSPEAARAVVDYLVGERLLTVRSDPEDMTKSLLDLSHEALIQNWDRLRGWLAEDPQGRAMREELRKAAEQWESGLAGVPPRSRRGLPGPDVAQNYLAWIKTSKPKLSPVQQEFAVAMRDMLTRRRRTRRAVMTALAGLAVASLTFAVLAYFQADKARSNEALAQKREQEAVASEKKARLSELKSKIEAASLALDNGARLCEEGRPRFGLLALVHSLQICPSGVADEAADDDIKAVTRQVANGRKVILTNLAGWGANVMCLESARAFPGRRAVATDRDGRYLLMENPDTTVQLFEIDTEKPVGKAVQPLAAKQPQIMATILPDGRAVLYGPFRARVWDLPAGKPLGKEFNHDSQGPAALSPDSKLVATGSTNGDVKLWDSVTGKRLGKPWQHRGKVLALTFSADGKHLVTGCGRRPDAHGKEEGVVHFYAIDEAEPLWRHAVNCPATAVAVSPDGNHVVGGGYEFYIWESGSGKQKGHGSNTESMAHAVFDPKAADELIVCNPSGILAVANWRENNPNIEHLSPQGSVVSTGFRPDGLVFTANVDGTIRIWHRPKRSFDLHTFRPPRGNGVFCVTFRPDGRAIALGTRDGFVYYYPSLDETVHPTEYIAAVGVAIGRRTQIMDVKFNADGRRLIAQDIQLRNFVFELNNPRVLPVLGASTVGLLGSPQGQGPFLAASALFPGRPNPSSSRPINFDCLALANDGYTALQRNAKKPYTYNLRDISTGEIIGRPFTIPGLRWPPIPTHDVDDEFLLMVRPADINLSRTRVLMIDPEGRAHLIDPATGKAVGKPLVHEADGVRDSIRSVTFNPQGTHALTRSPRARAVWSAETGALIDLQYNRIGVQVSRFSPSGNLVLDGTNYNSGAVSNLEGKPVLPVPVLHGSQVWGIAANPDASAIVTASSDRTARVWDTATGKQLGPSMLHTMGVSDAEFSPDGTKVLTGSWDGTARLWNVPRPLPDDEPRITAWIETMTGLRVSADAEQGKAVLMTADEWKVRRDELEKLGGPPIAFPK